MLQRLFGASTAMWELSHNAPEASWQILLTDRPVHLPRYHPEPGDQQNRYLDRREIVFSICAIGVRPVRFSRNALVLSSLVVSAVMSDVLKASALDTSYFPLDHIGTGKLQAMPVLSCLKPFL